MNESVLAAIAVNRARQNKARELNQRAGENLFKVFSPTELLEFTLQRLSGARRMAEVTDSSALLLPALDGTLAGKVLADNPDEVLVLDGPRRVTYRGTGQAPLMSFSDSLAVGCRWMQLPDEGVFLPGGRQAEVEITINYHSFRSVDIPRLKEKVREHFNREQWERFTQVGPQPEVTLPNLEAENAEVPAVRAHQYGTCAVTSEPLFAFGTVTVKGYRYYSSDPWFEVKWCRNREEAEALRKTAVEKLAGIRKEIAERALIEAAKAEAQSAKEHVKDVYGLYCSLGGKDPNVQEGLYFRAYGYLPEGLEELRRWKTETNELAEKASLEIADVREAARKREEEIAPLVERIGFRAEFVHIFVGEIVKLVGAEKAHRRLSAELKAPYGRARRQDALRSVCTGEKGQQFLALHQAKIVDDVLGAAVFWLEHKYGFQPIAESKTQSSVAPAQQNPPVSSGFGTSLASILGDLKL